MATVAVKVTIDRATAIIARHTAWGEITTTLDLDLLDEAQRAELARSSDERGVLDLSSGSFTYEQRHGYPSLAEATPEAALIVLTSRIASHESERRKEAMKAQKDLAEAEQAIVEWLAKSDDELLQSDYQRWFVSSIRLYNYQKPEKASNYAAYQARRNMLEEIAERKTAVLKAENARYEAERKAAKAKQEAYKAALMQRMVDEYCSDEQQRRRAEGLLPEEEMLRSFRERVFAPLNGFPRYEKISKADIVAATAYGEYQAEDDSVEYRADNASEASADVFAALEAIRKVAKQRLGGEVTCQLKEHLGGWKHADEWQVRKNSILVTVDLEGLLKLSREYAAP